MSDERREHWEMLERTVREVRYVLLSGIGEGEERSQVLLERLVSLLANVYQEFPDKMHKSCPCCDIPFFHSKDNNDDSYCYLCLREKWPCCAQRDSA